MHVLVIGCIFFVPQVICEPNIPIALMCEARQRIVQWFEGGGLQLGAVHQEDGVELRFAKDIENCRGEKTPTMFVNFSLEGVHPMHLFTPIADIEHQKEWYDMIRSVKTLDDPRFRARGARGARIQYVSGGFADRVVHEWEVYDKFADGSEYWFVATTRLNDPLMSEGPGKASDDLISFTGPVEAQNCLSAYRFKSTPTGTYAVFTNQIYGNPPLGIPQEFISKLTWGKTIAFVKSLQERALSLSRQGNATLLEPPEYMRPKQLPSSMSSCEFISENRDKRPENNYAPNSGSASVDHQVWFGIAIGFAVCILLCVCTCYSCCVKAVDEKKVSDPKVACIEEAPASPQTASAQQGRSNILFCSCGRPPPPRSVHEAPEESRALMTANRTIK